MTDQTIPDDSNTGELHLAHLRERHGDLRPLGGASLYEAQDGTQLYAAYGSKAKSGAWLAPLARALEQLDHPKGIYAVAFADRDEGKLVFFEIPATLLMEQVRARQLKATMNKGRSYSCDLVPRQGGRYRLTLFNVDVQDYSTGEIPVRFAPRAQETQDSEQPSEDQAQPSSYEAEQFLAETYMTREALGELVALLEDKKQMILYGPPGTGKTYIAQKLARYFVGGDEARVRLIQFHPSYSYEEFMEGIRPEARDDGPPIYPVRPGAFRTFCDAARGQEGRHVLIIDEINRGNIAKIFGELMFLLEYRQKEVQLPYSGLAFSIPENVYLIGTMNTADRSIALVDFALRRRFHFVHMGADRAVLKRWIDKNGAPVPYLLELFDAVNRAIGDRDYQIGFSHFMKPGLTEPDLARIWRYSIEPYLEEYFFDNRAKVDELRWDVLAARLRGAD